MYDENIPDLATLAPTAPTAPQAGSVWETNIKKMSLYLSLYIYVQ